jgi:hypothetical protein
MARWSEIPPGLPRRFHQPPARGVNSVTDNSPAPLAGDAGGSGQRSIEAAGVFSFDRRILRRRAEAAGALPPINSD